MSNIPNILDQTLVHIKFVVVSVAIGSTIAILLASILSRNAKVARFVMPIVSIFQTIPGIVFIGVLFVYTGMRPLTIYIALSTYAIFPVLKNTYAGIMDVDKGILEAARGVGMTKWQSLWRVELPLSMSSIFSGLRMATVYTVSWAVLAAMIGQGGLGEFIYIGIGTNIQAYILMGAIPAAILALVMGYSIDLLQKLVMNRGAYRES
ncbi:MAG: ABC transporter permease [Erysipelothrix sp.]|nr:ABC transporter permease [Erysipelothrix sp.]